jgi:ComF family protein
VLFDLGERRDALMRLVGDFKYNSEQESGRVIARLLNEVLPEVDSHVIVTAIPTAPPRIRQRGFDHTKLIARELSKWRALKFQPLLQRNHNQSQHDLSARDRKRFAQTVFTVCTTQGKIPEKILLIDDIWTTGATAAAAGRLLQRAGVKEIQLVIVAKQVGIRREFVREKTRKNAIL